jgi:TatD DNase family protein
LLEHRPVAIGEIGLDFSSNHTTACGRNLFRRTAQAGARVRLPVLLHVPAHRTQSSNTCANSVERPFDFAQDRPFNFLRTGIIHAFNGSRQQADEFIKLGFKLGFGGAMTYPRATKLRELAATLPLDSIVLETDAPDIPPDFLERGLPNEPKYLPRMAQTLAELRGMPLEEVARATAANSIAVMPALGASPL